MRLLVFFDLPTLTPQNRRDYSRFRRYLVQHGYLMLQQSVYCKLALNPTAANLYLESLRRNRPPSGVVQVLTITEKQFSRMEFLLGEFSSDIISSDERFIEL